MKVKILVIRFSSIGDIVLTTPVIRCLKQQVDGKVEVHFLTKNKFKSVLNNNPYLTKVYGIDKEINEVMPTLEEEQFDYVVDLHHNLRTYRVKKKLPGLSFSFNKLNWEKWLLVNLKINRMPSKHIVDRYLDTVAPLGVKNDNQGLDYFLGTEDKVDLTALPAEFYNGYIGFAIGGTYATKKLPTAKIISICRKLNKPIVLLGGPEDETAAKEIALKVGSNIYNACGKYKLNQSAYLVQQATRIITHDTGLMHIAAAFQKPIISVWGNTVPELGMYPYIPQHPERNTIVEVKELRCRPCSKLGHNSCPKKHFNCMNMIDETVF